MLTDVKIKRGYWDGSAPATARASCRNDADGRLRERKTREESLSHSRPSAYP